MKGNLVHHMKQARALSHLLLTAVAGLALVGGGFAQLGDFPTLKGGSSRQGKPADPLNTGPGAAFLNWFSPSSRQGTLFVRETIVDNADLAGLPGGSIATLDPVASWAAPNLSLVVASPAYQPSRQSAPGFPFVLNQPAYVFARCVAANAGTNPAAGWTARTLYSYSGTPGIVQAVKIDFHNPVGPTFVAPTGIAFPTRYAVFRISSGTKVSTEIIDTYAGGSGWVPLGNGGLQSTKVYAWDGVNPIIVEQLNTIPRFNQIDPANPSTSVATPVTGASASDFLVYSDAIRFTPTRGTATSSPIAFNRVLNDNTTLTTVSATDEITISTVSGAGTTFRKGVVTSFNSMAGTTAPTGTARWRFSPLEESSVTRLVDNTNFGFTPGWVSNNTLPRYAGVDCLVVPASNTSVNAALAQPTLSDGSYEVLYYTPGDQPGFPLARSLRLTVIENGLSIDYFIDLSTPGWKKVGDRRFENSAANPLKVQVSDQTTNPTDVGLGRFAYVDSMRFVGETNQTITSTPAYANVRLKKKSGVIEDTQVVVVADEVGRIHCLDALGNADGTTIEYWAYPSYTAFQGTAVVDPNQVAGLDGVGGIAEMPGGFGKSSPIIERVDGEDRLYIGSTNGRVYCIEMAGRGDYDDVLRKPGTTSRMWTYPSTYPTVNAPNTSDLGAMTGSVAFGRR